jgi:hypothetical protein
LIYIYAQGYLPFYGTDEIGLRKVEYYSPQQKYYEALFNIGEEKYCLVISIGVQKVPIFNFQTNVL